MNRGILCTIYAKPKNPVAGGALSLRNEEIFELYKEAYSKEPFIRLKEGQEVPRTKDVAYTNFCDISVKATENRIVILSAIDNLIKGASGQAVQNMNVMCGFDEKMGLL